MFAMERFYLSVVMGILQERRDEEGAAMVEYAILVAGIAVVVGAAVYIFGKKVYTLFSGISI